MWTVFTKQNRIKLEINNNILQKFENKNQKFNLKIKQKLNPFK